MIEKLKALEAAATPGPWPPEGLFDLDQRKANLALVEALRNLAPEIIAVLEAVESLDGPDACYSTHVKPVLTAWQDLRAKAAEVLR